MLAELHDLHAGELLRFCRWMLHDGEDAADAVQDTWIRALGALQDGQLRVVAHRPWLYAIARNVCLDRLRARKRTILHDVDETALGDAPGADEVAETRHEAAAALALVGTLSERQRSALLMRELAGMSIPDIAQALGLTPDRAAWAVTDARRALEEARAGSRLACQDIQDRLGAGRRSRALKTHLDGCDACRAHDRRLRARRVLAPAIFPFAWIRRWSWPAFSKPLAASVAVGLGAAALPVVHPVLRHPAPRVAPVARPAAPRVQPVAPALSRPAPRVAPRTKAVRHARAHHLRVVVRPAPVAASAPASTATPAVAVDAAQPVRPVRAVSGIVAAAVAPARHVLGRVLSNLAGSTQSTPAGPVVAGLASTVDTVAGHLR
jgi:RNA polymerase sigma factor (sigma-70 family)